MDMEKFLAETDSADYTYIITAVDILPEAEGELIVDRVDLQVFHTKEGLESRRIGVKGEARPYAFYRETAQNRAEVFVGRWYLAEIEKYEVVFLSLLALERRLAEQPCLILHCAYTEYQGKAMLFSAPSGTGKTTQAGLWEQYRGKLYRKWGIRHCWNMTAQRGQQTAGRSAEHQESAKTKSSRSDAL